VVNQGDEQWRFFAFESVEVTDTQDGKLKKRTMRVSHPASPAEILANLFNRLRGHSSTTSNCKCDVGWVMHDGELVLRKPKRDTTRGRKRQREDDLPAHLVCLHTLYEGSRAARCVARRVAARRAARRVAEHCAARCVAALPAASLPTALSAASLHCPPRRCPPRCPLRRCTARRVAAR
jgi:hypothetical protein